MDYSCACLWRKTRTAALLALVWLWPGMPLPPMALGQEKPAAPTGETAEAKASGDKQAEIDELLRQKELERGPTFPGKDPAFLVLPRAAERSRMAEELLTPEVKEMIEKALAYLVAAQDADGGWSDTEYPSNTGVTALGCLALMAQGSQPRIGRFGKSLDRGLEFLLNNVQSSGIIVGKNCNKYGPMYEHTLSTLALVMACGDMPWRPQTRTVVSRAIEALHQAQKMDGGWRYLFSTEGHSDMSVTANVLWVLRTAKKSGFTISAKTIERATRFIESCALPDGTFRYRYWGLHASPSLGGIGVIALCNSGNIDHVLIPPSRDRIAYDYRRYTVEDLKNREAFVYGCFYASIAMYACGDEFFIPWYKKSAQVLKELQRKDGEFADKKDNVVYPTAMAAIVLQAPYGYLPIYER